MVVKHENKEHVSRGDHQTNILKVSKIISPVAVFIKRNYLALVPGYLNRWFWRDLDSKFGVFWAVSGV